MFKTAIFMSTHCELPKKEEISGLFIHKKVILKEGMFIETVFLNP